MSWVKNTTHTEFEDLKKDHNTFRRQIPPQTAPSSSLAQQIPPSAQVEVSALDKITWYAILQLVIILAGIVFFIWMYGHLIGIMWTGQPSANLFVLFRALFWYIVVFTVIGMAIVLASLLYLWSGLRSLSGIDKANFSLPATLTLLMITGGLVMVAGELPYFYLFNQLLQQSIPPNFAAMQSSEMLSLSAIILGGGLLVLAGAIGGVVLGLWRVGVRCNETIIKVGAIFTIIPLLNYVAPILIIVGLRSCIRKIRSFS